MPRLSHPGLERDGVVRRLRLADGPGLRAPRFDVPGDPRRSLDRLSPARASRGARAAGAELSVHLAGPRGSGPRPGVGRGRILDRAVLADRPRRRARYPPLLRVALSCGAEATARGIR